MKQIGIISYCVTALILTFCVPKHGAAQNTDQNRERAIALWEEAIRAKGGRERLRSIQNFLVSSWVDVWDQTRRENEILAKARRDMLLSTQNVPVFSTAIVPNQMTNSETLTERLYAGPRKAWIYTYNPGQDISLDATVINRDRNLCLVTLAPSGNGVPSLSRCLPETVVHYLLQDPVVYLMETNWIRPEPIGMRTEGKGRNQLDVIETRVGKIRVDFYLDRKTRLPIKIVTEWYRGLTQASGRAGPMKIDLRNYAEIDGIQMPRKVSRELDDQSGPVGEPYRLDTERATYQFNVAYNPKIFEFPVPTTAKRRDWRKETQE